MNKGFHVIVISVLLMVAEVASSAALVRVKPLGEALQKGFFSAPAEVVNEHHVALSVEVSAVLNALQVRVGDAVAQGQVIAQLDCQDYRLIEEQAKQSVKALSSQVLLARQQLTRTRTLQKSGSASIELLNQRQTELSALTAQLKGQQAQVQQTHRNSERCTVTAPFDGVITQVMSAQGAWLSVGSPVVKILNIQQAEVSAHLLPEQLVSLQASKILSFTLAGIEYPLSVRASIPLINSAARTQQVRLSFINEPALSGATGELVWQAAQPSLPPEFLVRRQGVLGMMLAKKNQAIFIALPTAKEGQSVQLKPGESWEEGALLITQGQHVLQDGDALEIEAMAAVESNDEGVQPDAGTPAQ